jgi:uncharacterized protein YsxB (DUF464 family)
MVKILIIRDSDKNICGFKVSGHAGYNKIGADIVCSAISALTQTAVQGLKMVAGIDIQYKIMDRSGYLDCRLPEVLDDKQRLMGTAILETMYIGLKNIEKGYKKHIDIRENEEV